MLLRSNIFIKFCYLGRSITQISLEKLPLVVSSFQRGSRPHLLDPGFPPLVLVVVVLVMQCKLSPQIPFHSHSSTLALALLLLQCGLCCLQFIL